MISDEAQPIVKFLELTDSEVEKFVEESDKLVRVWREAPSLHPS